MFDTYSISPATPSSTTINKTVKEYRAPTDDSVKLLNEMQNKALENLLGQVKIQNNDFEVVAYSFADPLNFAKNVYLKYKLGHKEYEFKITLRQSATTREMANKMVEELSKDIAIHILKAALTPNVIKELMGNYNAY